MSGEHDLGSAEDPGWAGREDLMVIAGPDDHGRNGLRCALQLSNPWTVWIENGPQRAWREPVEHRAAVRSAQGHEPAHESVSSEELEVGATSYSAQRVSHEIDGTRLREGLHRVGHGSHQVIGAGARARVAHAVDGAEPSASKSPLEGAEHLSMTKVAVDEDHRGSIGPNLSREWAQQSERPQRRASGCDGLANDDDREVECAQSHLNPATSMRHR